VGDGFLSQAKQVVYDFSGLTQKNYQHGEEHGTAYVLNASYDERAMPVVRLQLMRAGVRLANVLNDALR
jgi:aromatic ring-opening dioxygenase catalytic subunit (LigB family)